MAQGRKAPLGGSFLLFLVIIPFSNSFIPNQRYQQYITREFTPTEAVSTANEVDSLSYREMQAECKALGLSASGRKEELRARLLGTVVGGEGLNDTDNDLDAGGGEGFSSPTSTKLLVESLDSVKVVKETGPMGKYILGKLTGIDILDAIKVEISSFAVGGSKESYELLSSIDPETHVLFGFVNKIGIHDVKVVLDSSRRIVADIKVEIVDDETLESNESINMNTFSLEDELQDILEVGSDDEPSGEGFSGSNNAEGLPELSLDDIDVGSVDDFWQSMGITSTNGDTSTNAGGNKFAADDSVLQALRELDAIDDGVEAIPIQPPVETSLSQSGQSKSEMQSPMSSLLSSVFEDDSVSASPEELAADAADAKKDLVDAADRGYYHSVVRAYRRWSRAANLNEKLKESKYISNESNNGEVREGAPLEEKKQSIFTITLRSCQRGRLGDEAETVFRELLELRRESGSLVTDEFNMVLSAYARGGAADQALRLLKNARQLYGLVPDIISFTTVIHGLSAAGDNTNHNAALQLVDEMRADPTMSTEDDLTVLRLTINAASRLGDWRRALQELQKARRLPQEERRWDMASLYTSVMAALNVAREHARLMEVFTMMEEDGVDPNGTGYGLAICAAARLGWDRAQLQVYLTTPQSQQNHDL
jgi:hypothetical protein